MRGMTKWEDTAEFYRFPIASVSKEDLEARGFDVSLIDGDKMIELAARMEEEYRVTCKSVWIDILNLSSFRF